MFGQVVPCPHEYYRRAERPKWQQDAHLIHEKDTSPLVIMTKIHPLASVFEDAARREWLKTWLIENI
jgi:hypothetical protein